MLFFYNLVITIADQLLKIVAFFSAKIKLFVNGRKNTFATLQTQINTNDKTIWFHCASLGEYEQGLPVMQKIKITFPSHKLIVTFFSPSGFEVRKNNTVADVTVYLPLDTKRNAKKFLKSVHPDLVFFIKYEFWPNYLSELKKLHIKTYLVSGIFRKNQIFFKWYGSFYKNALTAFNCFFVQNDSSKKLLNSIGFQNVIVSGDTRFDRVFSILKQDNTLNYIAEFKNNCTTVVIGSSWPADENLLIQFINNTTQNIKFIIAPHNINAEQIKNIEQKITKKTIKFSEKDGADLSLFQVFIIDIIGLLTKIYSYADIAYVGGGFGKPGVHNILEPATFGIPIIIGPNYSHFAEATALVHQKGCIAISNQNELNNWLSTLISNIDIRYEKGHICETFVEMNKGATDKILINLEFLDNKNAY